MPPPAVPTLDLHAQFTTVEADVRVAIERVLASQHFIQGVEGRALEAEVARDSGLRHGVAVSSGTDALLASLMALEIGPGDEVVTTPYTFVASVMSIVRLGAKPVFVDIDPTTFNLDATRVEAALTPRTRAVLPVHLFGQMSDLTAISRVAEAHGVPVIEDAAQALGAVRDGVRVGQRARAATLSFFPSKNLGAMGDAGMVLTDDDDFAARVRSLRNHGQEPKYVCQRVGGNFRMDELQAAVLRAKLPYLDGWIALRQRNVGLYRDAFAARGLAPSERSGGRSMHVELPARERSGDRHVQNQLVVRVRAGERARDALRSFLEQRGVGTAVYYPVPMHLQPAFADLGHRVGDFPEAERASRETLALPLYPELTEDSIALVADNVAAFFVEARTA